MMRNRLTLLFFIAFTSIVFAQPEPKHTFTVEVGMPVPLANKAFKWVMKPEVAVSPYYQYRLPNSLTFGIGAQYAYWQINKYREPSSQPAQGGIHTVGGFVKVGHEKFHNDRFATDVGVKFGYNQTYFITDYNTKLYGKPQQTMSASVTPTLAFILNVDEFSSYRFTIGYAFQGYPFSNQRLGVTENSGSTDGSVLYPTKTVTQYLVVGFGFTHYFSKNKNTGGDSGGGDDF